MKPPRYRADPAETDEPSAPYSERKPERFRTDRQRHGEDHEQGAEPYYRRPVNLGYSNLKRPKR